MTTDPLAAAAPTFLISRTASSDDYSIWQMDPDAPELFKQSPTAPGATIPATRKLCAVGGYVLSYDLSFLKDQPPVVNYQLFTFDPTQGDPLNAAPVQAGYWPQFKFWQYFTNYTWDPRVTDIVQLIPMTGYVMVYMPTEARGSYMLWNFDAQLDKPMAADPLPGALCPQDAFALIGEGSSLFPIANYVLEWVAATSTYRVWSFDPSNYHPLSLPYMSQGHRPDITAKHQFVVVGEHLLDIDTETGAYRLWGFDPKASDPFVGPLKTGILPAGLDPSSELTCVQTQVPIDATAAAIPGTMDFMRDNIDHVVVYMLESRTMDSVLGWLYETEPPHLNYVNADAPFKGNSFENYNYKDAKQGEKFHPYLYEKGEISEEFVLAAPSIDPFHATADCVDQQFSGGYADYLAGASPDMGGFVKNAQSPEAMVTFGSKQLPVLYGLAAQFSVSDYWFSPMPGGTIANRAIALSGSNNNITVNCEGEPQYSDYADGPMRQPIWKVLHNNGMTDWKIYYSVVWPAGSEDVFTYHLFMRGQLPSVDAHKDEYVQPIDQFFVEVEQGNLPKFTFLEPAWIAPTGATSYHPGASGDMVPGERMLNKIYKALLESPNWDRTALVITFSKGGGLYDHEVTPPAVSGWPHDVTDGFKNDVLGPRVPTIVVSPLVKPNTVFRSGEERPFEGTSLLSTILEWCGVPRARWGLGDRVPLAPTFEAVFQLDRPRTDKPAFTPPYDKTYPPGSED